MDLSFPLHDKIFIMIWRVCLLTDLLHNWVRCVDLTKKGFTIHVMIGLINLLVIGRGTANRSSTIKWFDWIEAKCNQSTKYNRTVWLFRNSFPIRYMIKDKETHSCVNRYDNAAIFYPYWMGKNNFIFLIVIEYQIPLDRRTHRSGNRVFTYVTSFLNILSLLDWKKYFIFLF